MFILDEKDRLKRIPMNQLKPCQLARIQDSDSHGEIVMRTSSVAKFEVMSLSKPEPDRCWTNETVNIPVVPFLPGESITLTCTDKY